MMKIVINNTYGGFDLPDEIVKAIGIEDEYDYIWDYHKRSEPKLVSLVEKQIADGTINEKDSPTELEVVEIPDETTDWTIVDYDGVETVYYVLDGKIKILDSDED